MTAFVLKIIASASMLVDHIGAVFPAIAGAAAFRSIGRLAFPIYAYMAAQSCKHTRNIYKYLLRLGLFALISEIPFDLAFFRYSGNPPFTVDYLRSTNVFYTLFLGVACVALYEALQKLCLAALPPGRPAAPQAGAPLYVRLFTLVIVLPVALLGNALDTDYGLYGVLYIVFFYLMKPENRTVRIFAVAAVVFVEYAYPFVYGLAQSRGIFLPELPGRAMYIRQDLTAFCCALAAAPLIFLYNGKRGLKLGLPFYLFYPAHLAALAAVLYLLQIL